MQDFCAWWLGYADDLAIRSGSEKEANQDLRQLEAACRYVGLSLNAKKTKIMCFNTGAKTRKNEDAMAERVSIYPAGQEGKAERAWIVDWDGVDLVPGFSESREERKANEGLRPTHLLIYDAGGSDPCRKQENGWTTIAGQAQQWRVVRLGMLRYVLPERNLHKCDTCGDYLPTARALKSHKKTGYCRAQGTEKELRTLRIARQVESRKWDERQQPKDEATVQTADGTTLEVVDQFRYLGTGLHHSGRCISEVTRRTGLALANVNSLKKVWRSRNVSKANKRELYEALAQATAMYNCETWALDAAAWGKLRAFQYRALYTMKGRSMGATDSRKPSRRELLEYWGVEDVERVIKEQTAGWIAHDIGNKNVITITAAVSEAKNGTTWGRAAMRALADCGLVYADLPYQSRNKVRDIIRSGRQFRKAAGAANAKAREETGDKGTEEGGPEQQNTTRAHYDYNEEDSEKIAGNRVARRDAKELVLGDGRSFKVRQVHFCENLGREEFVVGLTTYTVASGVAKRTT